MIRDLFLRIIIYNIVIIWPERFKDWKAQENLYIFEIDKKEKEKKQRIYIIWTFLHFFFNLFFSCHPIFCPHFLSKTKFVWPKSNLKTQKKETFTTSLLILWARKKRGKTEQKYRGEKQRIPSYFFPIFLKIIDLFIFNPFSYLHSVPISQASKALGSLGFSRYCWVYDLLIESFHFYVIENLQLC